jgi:nucleoside-diphosphate-sugar epimerase
MRVLITGATGFVGKNLCERLHYEHEVIAAVRRSSAREPNIFDKQFSCDLRSDFDWREGIKGVAAVVHCAARVHIMCDRSTDPLGQFREINCYATVNLARQAAEAGVKRFIFVSSIGVNGGETEFKPYSVSDRPAPHTPYARSKFEAELALRELAIETGIEVVVIRPPLVYGPNAPGNFATLMKLLVKGTPLPLASVVNNRRSFVFVDNLVDLIVTCLTHPAAGNETFLVSDAESLSTAALLRRLGDALGSPARLIPVPVPLLQIGAALLGKSAMAQRLCGSLEVDISKTCELLGWSPPISVDEGLRRTAEPFMRG